MQPSSGGPQVDYTGYVEGQPVQYVPQVRVMCAENYSSIFFPVPTCQRGTVGSPSVWGQGDSMEMTCPTNWRLERWWMASRAYNPILCPCHLGRGWSRGYHTPIYMLNHMIRVQAVVEITTNETARAPNLLAKQQTKWAMLSIKIAWT